MVRVKPTVQATPTRSR